MRRLVSLPLSRRTLIILQKRYYSRHHFEPSQMTREANPPQLAHCPISEARSAVA